ncbi:MAG: class I tRNA ligase family protein, partial [Polyangiales bacterium]
GPGAHSAILTLRLGLSVLLRLFAPVLPYITEELWSWDFASAGAASIHRAAWPTCAELSAVAPPDHPSCLSLAAAALGAIHKHKSEAGVSIGRPITALTLTLHPDDEAALRAGLPDVLQASRASDATLQSDAAVERGTVTVHSLTLADDSPRT